MVLKRNPKKHLGMKKEEVKAIVIASLRYALRNATKILQEKTFGRRSITPKEESELVDGVKKAIDALRILKATPLAYDAGVLVFFKTNKEKSLTDQSGVKTIGDLVIKHKITEVTQTLHEHGLTPPLLIQLFGEYASQCFVNSS